MKDGMKESEIKAGDLVIYENYSSKQYQGIVVEVISPRWVKVLWAGSHAHSEHINDLLKVVSPAPK